MHKSLRFLVSFFAFYFSFFCSAKAQTWNNVGSPQFSAGEAQFTDIAINGSGTPYVVYEDASTSNYATVMDYNGSSWATVGSAGFSAGAVQTPSIAIDGSGTPYVVYEDGGNSNKATVMKYNGSSWVTVGTAGFSAGVAEYTSIAIDGSGTPYVVYLDESVSFKATVMKYNGTSWVTVGTTGFTTGEAVEMTIAIDGSGTPYIAYEDYSSSFKASVMKFNGTSWVIVGSAGFSAGQAQFTSIAIDGSGTPYVAYVDHSVSYGATVMKYNGSSWVTVGVAGFSAGSTSNTSLAINSSGTPYVAYMDNTLSEAATVMSFNGTSWVNVGSAGFSAGGASTTAIAINSAGTPYVAYEDLSTAADKATVMKFSPAIAGSATVCQGATTTFSCTPTGGTWVSSATSVATVGISNGVVSGITLGTTTISYTVTGITSTQVVTVLPSPAFITGGNNVCAGNSINLYDVTSAGTWSTSNTAIGTVNSSGMVEGIAAGNVVISYTLGDGCSSLNLVTVGINTITKIAGTYGTASYTGDNGPATAATLHFPFGIYVDPSNNIFIADHYNSSIREINGATGIITTVAGVGTGGFSGDNGAATLADLEEPSDVTVDPAGNIYICDYGNNRIRKVNTAGIITTIAGSISSGFSGDGGPATAAELNAPLGIALDASGNLYIADEDNMRIRKVDLSGNIWTVAGSSSTGGFGGDGGPATAAQLWDPSMVHFDPSGDMYISDYNNDVIRKVDVSTGIITTVAGIGDTYGYAGDGGPATAARLEYPEGVNFDAAGNMYIADWVNSAVRVVNKATGIITTFAGDGLNGHTGDGGPATAAEIYYPYGIGFDNAGNLIFSDDANSAIRKVTPVASATSSAVVGASGVCVGSSVLLTNTATGGSWFSSNSSIASVGTTGIVTGISAGTTLISYSVTYSCGTSLQSTHVITVNPYAPITGGTYICPGGTTNLSDAVSGGTWSSSNTAVGTINSGTVTGIASGVTIITYAIAGGCNATAWVTVGEPQITSIAGGGSSYVEGAQATAERFVGLSDVLCDAAGNVYIADYQANAIRVMNTSGVVTTFAGNGTEGFAGDGGPATAAEFYYPTSMCFDAAGNMYITDEMNQRIRKINTLGVITTIAGTGSFGYNGSGIPATTAKLYEPANIAVDLSGNVYFTESYGNYLVRMITPSGYIYTIAGTQGVYGNTGNGGPATACELDGPGGIAVDSNGNVYVAESLNEGTIRMFNPNAGGIINIVAGKLGLQGYTGDGGQATAAELDYPGVYLDAAGDLLIPDAGEYVVRKVTPAGIISTIAGSGASGTGSDGDGSPATAASVKFSALGNVCTDLNGNIYIVDATTNNRIRKISYSAASPISGPSAVCVSATITLSDASSGGSWVSSNTAAGTVGVASGIVTGIASGTTIITYAGVLACGGSSAYVTQTVTVGGAQPISGSTTVCPGSTLSLTDATGGGTWSSSNTSIGSIGTNGVVTGVSVGNVTISYGFGSSCSALAEVMVGDPIITTIAGGGSSGLGDGGPATAAEMDLTYGICVDASNNLYIADWDNNRIRKVSAAGIITTVAGGGITFGDNGPATAAQLSSPRAIAVDAAGNLYIGDEDNQRVRKVNTLGIISTIAGNGSVGFSGDGSAATNAELENPWGIAVDAAGNVYIADNGNDRIRMVNTSGIISTYAGSPLGGYFAGDGGPATAAVLNSPQFLTFDNNGNLVISDYANACIRRVNKTTQIINTIAGKGGVLGSTGDGGPATAATFYYACGTAFDNAGNFYVSDYEGYVVRFVNASTGIISRYAGTGGYSYSGNGGPATAAGMGYVTDVALDVNGNLLISDMGNSVIRKVAPAAPTVTPITGSSSVCVGSQVLLSNTTTGGTWSSSAAAVATVGSTGIVTGVSAGSAVISYALIYACGTFFATQTVAVSPYAPISPEPAIVCPGYTTSLTDAVSGGTWSSSNTSIGSVNSSGMVTGIAAGNVIISYSISTSCTAVAEVTIGNPIVTTFAGDGGAGLSGDNGPATSASLYTPTGIAEDAAGNIYIAEWENFDVRKVSTTGVITQFAGTGTGGYSGDGGQATAATFQHISDIIFDPAGNMYVCDLGNGVVRKINTSGIVSTIAGTPDVGGFFGDGGPATAAHLWGPQSLSMDAAGDLFICDQENNAIRKVALSGSGYISTVAGVGGTSGSGGDNGPATVALLNQPGCAKVDAAGNIYICDNNNYRIRKVNTYGIITTICGTGVSGSSGDGGPATAAQIDNGSDALAVDNLGQVYITNYSTTNTLRLINTHDTITTIVGNGTAGFSGDGGAALAAEFNGMNKPFVDNNYNIYVTDENNERIRKITTTGISVASAISGPTGVCKSATITLTDAASGGSWSSSNSAVAQVGSSVGSVLGVGVGSAVISYSLDYSCGAFFETQTVTVSPSAGTITGNTTICPGITTTFTDAAGGGVWSSGSVPIGTVTNGGAVTGISVGNVIISYTESAGGCFAMAKVTVGNNIISTIAGGGTSGMGDGGPATAAQLNEPNCVVTDAAGNIYICDWQFYVIRKVNTSGIISIVAGSGTYGSTGDGGPATNADISPSQICLDASGNLIITTNTSVRKVTPGGIISTIAGSSTGSFGYSGDGGPATNALLDGPWGVVSDPAGNIYFSDGGNFVVREINTSGYISTVAGTPTVTGFSGDGGAATAAELSETNGLAIDYSGNIYVADGQNNRVRKFAPGGIIYTVAGIGGTGALGADGIAATNSALNYPDGIFVDGAGDLYIADLNNYRIQEVNTDGIVNTLAGIGSSTGFSGDGGPATAAQLGTPYDCWLDASGNIFIADASNERIRKVTTTAPAAVSAIAGPSALCSNNTINLTDASGGGVWSSSNTTVGTVGTSGSVTGITSGTTTISYTVTYSCGSDVVTHMVSVSSGPAAITPSDPSFCQYAKQILTDGTSGGAWSSSAAAIASVSGGTVSGVTAGTAVISYTIGICSAYDTVTVKSGPSQITGTNNICAGSNTTLLSTLGGTWSSTNTTVATIGSGTGAVTGLTTGTTIITYIFATGCYQTNSVTVVSAPDAISGPTQVCTGDTSSFVDLTSGGLWTSSNGAVGTVSATGGVGGVSSGTFTLSYSLGTGCLALKQVTVATSPAAITGTFDACLGNSSLLTDVTLPGAWATGNASVATVTGGSVDGVGAGTALISYTIADGCSSIVSFTVNPNPSFVVGATPMCTGATDTYTDVTPAGNWHSSNGAVATVNLVSGLVTAVGAGSALISYQLGTGCYAAQSVTVNLSPAAISGPSTLCTGTSASLTDGGSGTWTSSNIGVATIGLGTGSVDAMSIGSTIITYAYVSGCYVTTTLNVVSSPGSISGGTTLCTGSTSNLSSTSPGGTWVSVTTSVATIGLSSGTVTGVSNGTSIITYSLSGCFATTTVNVISVAAVASISGASVICATTPVTLTDATSGGVWSSSNLAVAVIGTTGSVSGVTAGTSIISYIVSNTCGTTFVTHTITVNVFNAGIINGSSLLCAGTFAAYTDTVSGGAWSVANASASIAGSGLLTGISSGTNIVSYSVTNACGTAVVTKAITIGAYLTAGTITGTSSVCAGSSTTLSDLAPGGIWSKSNADANIAASGGTVTVTGISGGVDTITYSISGSCGSAYAMASVTVIALPSAGTISGPSSICLGSTAMYTDGVSGGAWSVANATATIAAGLLSPVSMGTNIVSYTVTGSCGVAVATQTVNIGPTLTVSAITGITGVCVGAEITLTDPTSGGVWSASNGDASVSGGAVTGVSAGAVTISYTLTSGCGSVSALYPINVYPLPGAGTITGPAALCLGYPATYADGVGGGAWSLANSAATVSGGGAVTPLVSGTDILSYTVTNSCGAAVATQTITIAPTTPISNIVVPTGACLGSAFTLTDPIPGGSWTSGNTSVATINTTTGVAMGVALGTSVITYTVVSSCGTASVNDTLTISNPAVAGSISGTATVCAGSYVTLSDGVSGGSWSSSNADATVSGGIVTGVTAGSATISYTVTNSCSSASATHALIVDPALTGDGISGGSSVCAGGSLTLTDGIFGGTWTSATTSVAIIGASTGILVGVTGGTDIVSYTLTTGCGTTVVTTTVTVNTTPNAGAITGASAVCDGFTASLTESVSGGNWTSSNTSIATVGMITGIVNGVSAGTTVISYSVTNSCGIAYATETLTVDTYPVVTAISGTSVLCTSVPLTFTDGVAGGTWTTTTGNASVGTASGIVTGVTPGTDIVSYTITNACSSAGTTFAITINPSPNPGIISGPDSVCTLNSVTLTDAVTGGTWSESNTDALLTGGTGSATATGITAGLDLISYSVSNSCGTASAVLSLTVVATPNPGTITGSAGLCPGATIVLTDTVSGGAWYRSNTNASIDSAGLLTGINPGTDSIFYSITDGCGTQVASKIITIYPVPAVAPVLGTPNQCAGSTIDLTDPTSGGVWSSSNIAVGTVNNSGMVTGIATGVTTISYTVTNTYGCITAMTAFDTVSGVPVVAPVTGITAICLGSSVTLSDDTTGGTWSSSNTGVATVLGGLVNGASLGTATISYTVSNGCGATAVTALVSVVGYPSVTAISGAGDACPGIAETFTDGIGGGVWSSSSTGVATVGSSTGIVTGITGGTATIYYAITNACGTASVSAVFTVDPLPYPGTVSGAAAVCIGSTITLTDAVTGGTWSAGNTDATVTGGVVTAISAGVDPISYTLTNSCGSASAVLSVTVDNFPTVDSVLGATAVCTGSTITLTDATTGGTWLVSNGTASVSGGVVTGISAGIDTVIYAVTNACASVSAIRIVTIHISPDAGAISGSSSVCVVATITLTESVTGGSWSSSNAAATVSGGLVTGAFAGTDTIIYAVTNSCGTATAEQIVSVNGLPDAGSITGASSVCVASDITLTDAATGGVWSATNTDATVTGGMVSGISAGVDTIKYTVTNTCGAAVARIAVTVSESAGAGTITGPTSVCNGGSITLADVVTGGTWSSSGSNASVVGGSASATVTGHAAGIDTIRYAASNGCGAGVATKVIDVITVPSAGTITGLNTVCPGNTITLADFIPGGVWSSGNTAIATVSGGVVTGITAGPVNISYSVSNTCGTGVASYEVDVLSADECNTGVNTVTGGAEQLLVNPNPNSGSFVLKLVSANNEAVQVTITDMLGQQVQQFVTQTNQETGVTVNKAAGMYIITAQTAHGTFNAKVTIE